MAEKAAKKSKTTTDKAKLKAKTSKPTKKTVSKNGVTTSTRRAIDFKEGEKINEKALGALIQEAVKFNKAKAK